MYNCHVLAAAAYWVLQSCAFPASAQSYTANSTDTPDFTVFNPPKLTPFLHIDLQVGLPVNATTLGAQTARYNNVAGNVTGCIEGQILELGAAFEILPPATNGVVSFYTNQFSINTTSSTVLLMDAKAAISYANDALHGFGTVNFDSGEERYQELSFDSFVVEFESIFRTGKARLDVYRLESAGKRDGSETPALLPPGKGVFFEGRC